jgi:hypothetical protein
MPDTGSAPTPDPSADLDSTAATRGSALVAALAALDALAELGETIEDEWTYVTALAEAGRSRLRAAAGADLDATLPADRAAAVGAACTEIALISDPHRAIDWLSTFPAVVELAFGAPAATASAPGAAPASAPGAGAVPPAASASSSGAAPTTTSPGPGAAPPAGAPAPRA